MFSAEELGLLSNKELFVLKSNLIKKISGLFGSLSDELKKEMVPFQHLIPVEALQSYPKISRGENYHGFPWMVLDYPRSFIHEDVFAFRSLCWWGHEFSFTLHLGGKHLDTIRPFLTEFLATINNDGIYICIHDSPWNYYFEKDNYQLLSDFLVQEKDITEWSSKRTFIKLSKTSNLENYHEISKTGSDFLKLILQETKKYL